MGSTLTPVKPSPSRPYARGVLSGTAAAGISSFGTVALSLLLLPVQLTGLGTEAFGAWVVIQTLSSFRGWGGLLDLGAGPAATRLVAERLSLGDERGAASASIGALIIAACGGVFGATLLASVATIDPGRLVGLDFDLRTAFATSLAIYGFALPFELVTRAAQMSLEGLQRVSLSRGLELGRRTLVLITTSSAAYWTGDLVATVIAFAVTAPVVTAVTVMKLRRHLHASGVDRQSLRTLLVYGRPLLTLRPLGIAHRMMDRLLVGVVLGPAAVAVVEIVTVIQSGAQAVLSAGAQAVMPSAAWLEARADRRAQRILILKGTLGCLFATLPVVIVPALLGEPLLRLWLGDDAPAGAATLLPFALAYSAIVATAHVASEFLTGSGRAGIVLRWAFFAVVGNLILTIVLLPRIGVLGAFAATLVTAPVSSAPIVAHTLSVIGVQKRQFVREALNPVILPALALSAVVLGAKAIIDAGDLLLVGLGAVAGGVAYLAVGCWTIPWRSVLAGLRAQSTSKTAD